MRYDVLLYGGDKCLWRLIWLPHWSRRSFWNALAMQRRKHKNKCLNYLPMTPKSTEPFICYGSYAWWRARFTALYCTVPNNHWLSMTCRLWLLAPATSFFCAKETAGGGIEDINIWTNRIKYKLNLIRRKKNKVELYLDFGNIILGKVW